MRKISFIIVIIACAGFFSTFIIVDELYVPDPVQEQIYEGAALTIVLGILGIVSAKFYGDLTTIDTVKEFKYFKSEIEQKINNLESKIDDLQNDIKDH